MTRWGLCNNVNQNCYSKTKLNDYRYSRGFPVRFLEKSKHALAALTTVGLDKRADQHGEEAYTARDGQQHPDGAEVDGENVPCFIRQDKERW